MFGRSVRQRTVVSSRLPNRTPINSIIFQLLLDKRVGTKVALCKHIMLNQNRTNELIELGCRIWWGEKKNASTTEKTANAEEFISIQQDKHKRKTTVPPESVYFAIELA